MFLNFFSHCTTVFYRAEFIFLNSCVTFYCFAMNWSASWFTIMILYNDFVSSTCLCLQYGHNPGAPTKSQWLAQEAAEKDEMADRMQSFSSNSRWCATASWESCGWWRDLGTRPKVRWREDLSWTHRLQGALIVPCADAWFFLPWLA